VGAVFAVLLFFVGSAFGKKYLGHRRYLGEEAEKIYNERKGKVPESRKFGPYERGGRKAVPQLEIKSPAASGEVFRSPVKLVSGIIPCV